MNVTDRQTNGWTEGHHTTAYAALMHSIARQKSASFDTIVVDYRL